jgi:broad specificity phosphatase PhoE
VRHGEKAGDDPNDPTLSDSGKKRAAALAKMLSRAKLEHLYCTEFKRARMMLEPLAQASHAPITVVPAAKIDTLVHELQALPGGSVAVVVGHSNTLPEIARQLGGQLHELEQTPNGLMIRDAEYGRFVVLTIPNCPGGTTSTLELQYGD